MKDSGLQCGLSMRLDQFSNVAEKSFPKTQEVCHVIRKCVLSIRAPEAKVIQVLKMSSSIHECHSTSYQSKSVRSIQVSSCQ